LNNKQPDNRIRFESKSESNARRTKEALDRKPEDRLRFFLDMIGEFAQFYPTREKDSRENFILKKKNAGF